MRKRVELILLKNKMYYFYKENRGDVDTYLSGLNVRINNKFSVRYEEIEEAEFYNFTKFYRRDNIKPAHIIREINNCVLRGKEFHALNFYKTWSEVPDIFTSSKKFSIKERAFQYELYNLYNINEDSKVDFLKHYNKNIKESIFKNLIVRDSVINELAIML